MRSFSARRAACLPGAFHEKYLKKQAALLLGAAFLALLLAPAAPAEALPADAEGFLMADYPLGEYVLADEAVGETP